MDVHLKTMGKTPGGLFRWRLFIRCWPLAAELTHEQSCVRHLPSGYVKIAIY